jgi:antitoxin PrlF
MGIRKARMPYPPALVKNMSTLTITSKGQVTFKKGWLEHLKAKPGDRLEVRPLSDGRLEIKVAPAQGIESVFGLLAKKTAVKATLADIKAASERAWTGHR